MTWWFHLLVRRREDAPRARLQERLLFERLVRAGVGQAGRIPYVDRALPLLWAGTFKPHMARGKEVILVGKRCGGKSVAADALIHGPHVYDGFGDDRSRDMFPNMWVRHKIDRRTNTRTMEVQELTSSGRLPDDAVVFLFRYDRLLYMRKICHAMNCSRETLEEMLWSCITNDYGALVVSLKTGAVFTWRNNNFTE